MSIAFILDEEKAHDQWLGIWLL